MYKVIHVSCISRSWLDNTREVNDFVHAKRLPRKKPMLALGSKFSCLSDQIKSYFSHQEVQFPWNGVSKGNPQLSWLNFQKLGLLITCLGSQTPTAQCQHQPCRFLYKMLMEDHSINLSNNKGNKLHVSQNLSWLSI